MRYWLRRSVGHAAQHTTPKATLRRLGVVLSVGGCLLFSATADVAAAQHAGKLSFRMKQNQKKQEPPPPPPPIEHEKILTEKERLAEIITDPNASSADVNVARIELLLHNGQIAAAAEQLDAFEVIYPADERIAGLRLSISIAEKRQVMRGLVREESDLQNLVLGDPDYEMAKAQSTVQMVRRLNHIEFLIHENKFARAVELTQDLVDEYRGQRAPMLLMNRLLDHLLDLQRQRIENEKRRRRGEELIDVAARGTLPVAPRALPRQVFVFQEDLDESDRRAVVDRLKVPISVDYQEAPVDAILKDLFSIAGMNYFILDSALVEETLTISLVDQTVENILMTVQEMVELQFNYRGGSVFITGGDAPVMRTEIIRLSSGLTDVMAGPQMGGGGGGEGGGGAGGFSLGGEGSSDLERFLERLPSLVNWPEGSEYYLERKSNTLYLRSSSATIAEVKRLLHALDYNNVQVLIEARFIEVSDTASRDLGVNWQVAGTSSYGSDGTIGAGISSGVTPSPLGLTADTLGAAVGSTLGAAPGLIGGAVGIGENAANFAFTINALERRGQADTLSEPSVLALNNQVAVIDITRDVGYVSDFENRAVSSGGVSGTGNTTNVLQQQVLVPRYETEQEFIRLNVRPSVARNSDIITLTVSPQVRELSGFVGDTQFNSVSPGTTVLGSTPINQPLFTERQMSSTVHIKNNQFIVLGGLVQERDQINEEGIPGLIDLGLARRLFGTEGKSLERRKLLVVVMVHMIDPSGAEYDDIQEYVLDNARAALPSYIRRQERERLLLENRRAAIKASELNDERRTREQQLNAPSGKSGRDGGSDGL